MNSAATIAIIGAGIQGCSIAMALANKGYHVELFDQAPKPMSRASLWNEGKLHLGYVYGRDTTLNTAHAMIKGSLDFYNFFKPYLGVAIDKTKTSTPFNYVVHKQSLLSPEEVFRHLQHCAEILQEQSEAYGNYWNSPVYPPQEYTHPEQYNPDLCQAVFSTPEISIDVQHIAQLIQAYVAQHPRIHLRMGSSITKCERLSNTQFQTTTEQGDLKRFTHLINTSWESRLHFDKQLGYEAPFAWLHRYKLALHIRNASIIDTPSSTIVLGPFGDLVNFNDGSYYLSWYPSSKIGESTKIKPPEFDQRLSPAEKRTLSQDILKKLSDILPEVSKIDCSKACMQLQGGHIFAWGAGEVDIYDTQLHERYSTGVFHDQNYFSVNTGKYCSATLNTNALTNYF